MFTMYPNTQSRAALHTVTSQRMCRMNKMRKSTCEEQVKDKELLNLEFLRKNLIIGSKSFRGRHMEKSYIHIHPDLQEQGSDQQQHAIRWQVLKPPSNK